MAGAHRQGPALNPQRYPLSAKPSHPGVEGCLTCRAGRYLGSSCLSSMGDKAGESGTKSPSVRALLCGVPSPASSSPSSLSPESRSNRDSGTSNVKPNRGTRNEQYHRPSVLWGGGTPSARQSRRSRPRCVHPTPWTEGSGVLGFTSSAGGLGAAARSRGSKATQPGLVSGPEGPARLLSPCRV